METSRQVGKSVSSARELLVGPPGTAVSLNVTRHESLFGIDAVKVRLSLHMKHTAATIAIAIAAATNRPPAHVTPRPEART